MGPNTMILVGVIIVVLTTTKKVMEGNRMLAGIIQLIFTVAFFVVMRPFLGISITEVTPDKTMWFVIFYALCVICMLIYVALGIGNIMIASKNKA